MQQKTDDSHKNSITFTSVFTASSLNEETQIVANLGDELFILQNLKRSHVQISSDGNVTLGIDLKWKNNATLG